MRHKNLTLVGPMGAGKSTIGRLLARELQLSFKDSDREIEERTGASIPLIFDLEGEEGFRIREEQVIDELLQERGLILATGGGAILKPANRERMANNSTVIYLHTSVEHQLERTARDKNRPLLQTENPRKVLENLLKIREPLYREIADIIIETDTRPPRLVVQEIIEQLAALV